MEYRPMNEEEHKIANQNMIVKETERAVLMKVNYIEDNGIDCIVKQIWVPKSHIYKNHNGLLVIDDYFKREKSRELGGGYITPYIKY